MLSPFVNILFYGQLQCECVGPGHRPTLHSLFGTTRRNNNGFPPTFKTRGKRKPQYARDVTSVWYTKPLFDVQG